MLSDKRWQGGGKNNRIKCFLNNGLFATFRHDIRSYK